MSQTETKSKTPKDEDKEGGYASSSSSTPDLTTGDATETEDSAEVARQQEIIRESIPKTPLEIAQAAAISRQMLHIERLSTEVKKLKAFISKRKQTYKRKRKDEGAPTRPLSAYNLYVRERFAKLAKDNENALHSDDTSLQLKRVPPASMVASTGNEWKDLPAEEKRRYEEMAAADKKRYDEQMANYSPPESKETKKRNKTGYNMFFSAYVAQLKQSAAGVPPERGSVARLVGNAWKELTSEEKQYYETEAEKRNETLKLEANHQADPKTAKIGQRATSPKPGEMPTEWLASSPINHQHYHGGEPPHQHFDGYGYAPPFPGYYGAPQHGPPGRMGPPMPPHGAPGPPGPPGPPGAPVGHYDPHHHHQPEYHSGRTV